MHFNKNVVHKCLRRKRPKVSYTSNRQLKHKYSYRRFIYRHCIYTDIFVIARKHNNTHRHGHYWFHILAKRSKTQTMHTIIASDGSQWNGLIDSSVYKMKNSVFFREELMKKNTIFKQRNVFSFHKYASGLCWRS